MKTKIYTKVGDKGQTSLLGGAKVSKADARLDAYGTIDELNAAIGVALAEVTVNFQLRTMASTLEKNQHLLFVAGSQLACADEKLRKKLPALPAEAVTHLESAIDELETHLPELKEFILPGGSRGAALLHVARTVCRRAERHVVQLASGKKKPSAVVVDIVKYLNRLGDFLFVAARFANVENKTPETKWIKP
jgi:cob(I)alamin adenosyltransferase